MQTILDQLKLKADVMRMETNGTITKYYIQLRPGAKVSKIENCSIEIALGMKAYSKPIIRIIPEQGLICIELLIKQMHTVNFNEFDNYFKAKNDHGPLPIILGRAHDGQDLIVELSTMPHLLIAGTTGSGKSVLLHSIITSLIKADDSIKLALIDPKQVEFSCYSEIKNLLYPIVADAEQALDILSDLVEEMEIRFRILNRALVNNILIYNKINKNRMPYIVLIIDEFADLMQEAKKIFQTKLCILAQKARACGIHIIIATQRPSVDVITGVIKANFSSRISCKVSSLADSRVILDKSGAEKLLGHGDALINSAGFDMIRFQGAYVSIDDIKKLCSNKQRSKWSKILNYF